MSLIILNVDEVRRTLSASGGAFVVHDKEVDIVRFAINSGFADIVLDGQVALRVMYQRPGESQVRAQTLTYYDTDGLHNYYDWQLAQSDLAKNGSLTVALCILDISGGEVSEWHTTPCAVRVLSTIHTDDSDEGDDTITPTVKERVAVLESMIQRVASGAPIVVASTSEMTDTEQIYVLSTDGNWYYHNGSSWVAGGEYGAVATDTTLTQSGIPADAKAVGDEIVKLKADLNSEIARAESEEARIEALFTQPVEEAVSDWLNEHPEATTTVEDGSLTETKFSKPLKLKTINNYVTPEMFGAKGDGTTDDTNAFDDMFVWLAQNPVGSSEEVKCYDVVLTSKYSIGIIDVPDGIDNITIKGGTILNGGFLFDTTTGWRVFFEEVTFISALSNGTTAIKFNYRNKEYGRYVFKKCVFWHYLKALHIERRSCNTIVENCTFKDNGKTAYILDNDYFTFRNNWVEINHDWEDDHDDLEIVATNEGDCHIIENFFIPGYSITGDNPCWVKTGKTANILRNRFSGENLKIHPVHICFDNYATFSVDVGNAPIVNICENIMAGASSILLDKFCGRINFDNNTGWTSAYRIIDFYNQSASDYYDSLNRRNFAFAFSGNTGRTFNFVDKLFNNIPKVHQPSIPESLYKFVDKGRSSKSQNEYYETAINGNVLTIKLPNMLTSVGQGIYERLWQSAFTFLVRGHVKFAGSRQYNNQFLVLISLDCAYINSAVVVKPVVTKIYGSELWDTITYTAQVDGGDTEAAATFETNLKAGNAVIDFTVSYTGGQTPDYYFDSITCLDNVLFMPNAIVN